MVSPALRPRSATELVDAAFQLLRAHYAPFVMCAAIGYLPLLLVELVIYSDRSRLAGVTPQMSVVLGLALWVDFALMAAVIMVCASQAYLGERLDVATALRRALPRLPLVMVGAVVRYAAMLLGAFAFLVGALYFAARFFAVTPAIVLERAGIAHAFSRSTALSNGRKWHILGTLALSAIIYWVLVFGIQMAVVVTGAGEIVQALVGAVLTILVYPVVAITQALLYYDTRIKHEGLDIELMAGALDATPASEPTPP